MLINKNSQLFLCVRREVVMMKFKNTLIIFLGIIAIIFAGCKEKKATHESGIIAEPQKSETYEENGISYSILFICF